MPELPEVQTIVNDLNKYISGYKIIDVDIMGGYRVYPSCEEFKSGVVGKPITKVTRVAKNILIELNDNKVLLFHLAMTGRILLHKEIKPQAWARVILKLNKNSDTTMLTFSDMRMFGKASLMSKEEVGKLKSKYGPEPIENITNDEFYKQIKKKHTNIKNALLDQKIISGLGNIYATDALFMAGIHPETSTKDITPEMAGKLLDSARKVLLEGIEHRGSTLGDRMYVDIFGKEGSHQKYFKIYGKKICPRCKSRVEFKKIAGRGTYYCPVCQK